LIYFKVKGVPPPAARADAGCFCCAKINQNAVAGVGARLSSGSLRCSRQAGRKELATLRHLFVWFRPPLRSSAPPWHKNVNGKVQTQKVPRNHKIQSLLSFLVSNQLKSQAC